MLQLLVVLALAAGLGGYAYFGVFQKDQREAEKKEHETRLFAPQQQGERAPDGGAATAEFRKLVVTFKGEVTTLTREPGGPWRIVSPVQARADKLVLDGLTSQLQSSKFKAALEEHPDAATLAKYGLDTPQFTVEAEAEVAGAPRRVTLRGGIENPFDGSVFMQRNDDPTVFTAEGGVRYALARTTFDLRDKQLFAVDEAKVRAIATRSKSNDWALARGADGLWALTRPVAEPADGVKVSALLGALAGEKAQRFLDDGEAARKASGFDAPEVDTTLTLDDGATVRLRVARAPGADTLYGLREDAEGAVLAEVTPNAKHADLNLNELKDKTVLRFKKELVTKIAFRDGAGAEVVVQKDAVDASADAWRVTAPRAGKAKVFKVTAALWTLGGVKAQAVGEEHPKDWGRYGLDARARSITLFGEDGAELGRFAIGLEVPNKAAVFYVRGARDQVLEADGARFKELPFSLAELLDEPAADAGP